MICSVTMSYSPSYPTQRDQPAGHGAANVMRTLPAQSSLTASKPRPVKVILKTVALVECLSQAAGGIGISELSRKTGGSKATVHNILSTLVEAGVVIRDPFSSRYLLGPKVARWGSAFLDATEVGQIGPHYLDHLRDITGETSALHLRIGFQRICIAQALSSHALRRVLEIGKPRPLWSGATGFVLMMGVEPDEVLTYLRSAERLRLTPTTPIEEHEIVSRIAMARHDGYSINSEETSLGVTAVSMPVRARGGAVVAAVTVSGPATRWNHETISKHVPTMLEWTTQLSHRLGWDS